jgi:hypothetical protein
VFGPPSARSPSRGAPPRWGPLALAVGLAGFGGEPARAAPVPVEVAPGQRLALRDVPIQIRGNVVLSAETYLTFLSLARAGAFGAELRPDAVARAATSSTAPPSSAPAAAGPGRARPTDLELAAEAEAVASLLSDFLKVAGYDLAHVAAYPRQGGIVVEVDEGRLDKIIFVGQDVFRALELQLSFNLPGRVFNRPLVEQQLANLTRVFGLDGASFEVVDVENPGESRVDIDRMSFLRTFEVLRPGEAHELRVHLRYKERSPGLRLGIAVGSIDGFAVEGGYLWRGLLGPRDRLELSATVGARIADPFAADEDRVGLARVRGEVEYQTPPFLGGWGAAVASISGDLQSRRRPDLDLGRYYFIPIRAQAGLAFEGGRVFSLELTAGVEQAYVFGVEPRASGNPPPDVTDAPGEFLRAMGSVALRLHLNPDEVYFGRAHRFDVDLRAYPDGERRTRSLVAQASYRLALGFGYDELRLRAEGTAVFGDVRYFEQVPLGFRHLQAAYQDVFVDRAGTGGVEYRFALVRDLMKLGTFASTSVVSGIGTERGKVQVLGELGLALHLLVLESLEASVAAALGLSSLADRDTTFGAVIEVRRAF